MLNVLRKDGVIPKLDLLKQQQSNFVGLIVCYGRKSVGATFEFK